MSSLKQQLSTKFHPINIERRMIFTRRHQQQECKPMMVLAAGMSIFYDSITAEEAREGIIEEEEETNQTKNKNKDVKREEQRTDEEHNGLCFKGERSTWLPWAELPEVRESGVLDTLTRYQLNLQETKFEIITSEMRYLNALNEVKFKYMDCKELSQLCSDKDWEILFGNIIMVKAASEMLLNDLVTHLQDDIMLRGIYNILRQHATSSLRFYEDYCRNCQKSQKLLLKLMSKNPKWKCKLEMIETDYSAHNTLHSYLSQPVQRVTRLPLLLQAIATLLEADNPEYTACKLAINVLKQLAERCNTAVGEKYQNPTIAFSKKIRGQQSVKIKNKIKPNTEKPRSSSWTFYTSWEI